MKLLKQSMTDWSFYNSSIDPKQFYEKVKSLGYDAVEMAPPERRRAVTDAGLINLNLSGPGMEVGLNNVANHAVLVPGIMKAIDEAVINDISDVIIFSGNRNGQPDEEGIKNCVTAIKEVVGYAEKKNITLLFEMLNSYDHVDYQADSSHYGFSVVDAVGSSNLKALYDVYHMFRMGEDVINDLKERIEIIGHIHMAGSPTRNCIADANELDHAPVIEAIRGANYDGFVGQEFLVTNDCFDELERAYRMVAP